ncbi:MAG: type II secretion system protein [Candidatus Omnitrophica bacterium]|nr:type II secretion system protein [Candidatus Omnitrophota bacterium]
MRHKENKRAFTLTELILVVGIIALLAGIMIPVIKGAIEDAKIARLLNFADALALACKQFNSDTGSYALETILGGPLSTNLSTNGASIAGWDGPYCRPLSDEDNPFDLVPGGIFFLLAKVAVNNGVQYDLDGDGALEINGPGNDIQFYPVPDTAAKKINDIYDKNVPGDWKSTGKVRYWPGAQGVLFIYLMGGH